MPSLKDLRTRINSVKNTQKITKTMKMVSAAKVRRARAASDAARPYAQRLQYVLQTIAASTKGGPQLLVGRPSIDTVRYIVCGADRGLCGGLNANMAKELIKEVRAQQKTGRTVQIIALGKKIRSALPSDIKNCILETHEDVGKKDALELAKTVGRTATEAFESDDCDAVYVMFAECTSMLAQTPMTTQVIPFLDVKLGDAFDAKATSDMLSNTAESSDFTQTFDYEPNEEAVLNRLLPMNVTTQILRGVLETTASEHAARMTAMDNATRNAGEMINSLTLDYNRSRQAAITKELIEIISGAEAV